MNHWMQIRKIWHIISCVNYEDKITKRQNGEKSWKWEGWYSLCWCILPQVQEPAFAFIEFQTILPCPSPQPAEALLKGSQHSGVSALLSGLCCQWTYWECIFILVIDEYVKPYWAQYWTLGDTSDRTPN